MTFTILPCQSSRTCSCRAAWCAFRL